MWGNNQNIALFISQQTSGLHAFNATYMQYMNHQIEVIEVLKPDGDFWFIVVWDNNLTMS